MIHSTKRSSIFSAKSAKTQPPPALKAIYRNYLKSSLAIYKHCNPYIASYLFKFLSRKRSFLELKYLRVSHMKNMLQEVEGKDHAYSDSQQVKKMFKKSHSHSQEQLIKIRLQYARMQQVFLQHLLYTFQSFHHLSTAINDALNPQNSLKVRQSQMSKLVHIIFNISQYFTPTLLPRKQYQSLLILDHLDQDMEFEVLSDKDKQFVRDVVIKVCGKKHKNHTRFRTANDYLKDPNAILYQTANKKIQLSKTSNKIQVQISHPPQNADNQAEFNPINNLTEEQIQKEQDEHADKKDQNDMWSLLSQRDRDRAVRQILSWQKSVFQQKQNQKPIKTKKHPSKTLLFQIIQNLSLNITLKQPQNLIQQQLYEICRRLFKIQAESSAYPSSSSQQNQPTQDQRLPLLEDAIIEYAFLDEFINKKKIIIV